MARLLYETIQFSPFVWDGDVDLATQFEAAAAAGFDGVGIDVWSVDQHLSGGGTVSELVEAKHVWEYLQVIVTASRRACKRSAVSDMGKGVRS